MDNVLEDVEFKLLLLRYSCPSRIVPSPIPPEHVPELCRTRVQIVDKHVYKEHVLENMRFKALLKSSSFKFKSISVFCSV